MLQRVDAYCRLHGLLRPGEGVIVACSGGADSLVLLDLLLRLRARYGLRLTVAHFEHGIRGQASKDDASFVAAFCRERDIDCRIGRGDVPSYAAEHHLSLETAARTCRYEFLEHVRVEVGADVIATAHQADDQAETVLMRILRGTGTEGLGAIRPQSGTKIRPLLDVTRREIEAYAAERGLMPRHDASNDMPDCTRNRLRLLTLPKLRDDYNPELTQALCRLASLAQDDDAYLTQMSKQAADHVIVKDKDGWILRRDAFLRQMPAIQRRLIRIFLETATGSVRDVGFLPVERLRNLLQQGGTGREIEISGGHRVSLAYGMLRLVRPAEQTSRTWTPVTLTIPGVTRFGSFLCQAAWRDSMPAHCDPSEFYLNPDELTEPLMFRTRCPGDTIQLPGGRKKIKALLIDDKIPRAERDSLPLLASGREILWVVGHRRSSLCPVVPGKHGILYLRIERREE